MASINFIGGEKKIDIGGVESPATHVGFQAKKRRDALEDTDMVAVGEGRHVSQLDERPPLIQGLDFGGADCP